MIKDTPNGRIILSSRSDSNCIITPEMEKAADACFVAWAALNKAKEEFEKTIPNGFAIENFYGKGDTVIVRSQKELDAEAEWWKENG
jgi:hypothetical protein